MQIYLPRNLNNKSNKNKINENFHLVDINLLLKTWNYVNTWILNH